MTNRFHTAPDWSRYDTLLEEAVIAFGQDVGYVIEIVESARSISAKKRKSKE